MTSKTERLAELRDRRSLLLLQMQRALDRAENEDRGFDAEEQRSFDSAKLEIGKIDREAQSLELDVRSSLEPVSRSFSGMDDVPNFGAPTARAAMVGPRGLLDVGALYRGIERSEARTLGRTDLPLQVRALVQGVGVGQLGRTRLDDLATVEGRYGALPLVLAVQLVPCDAGIYHYNRLRPKTAPALGGKQATEGAAKTNVEVEGVPTSATLETWAAFEKVSLQALQDQDGLAGAVESILTGAVFRAADAAAWTAIVAGSTATVPAADPVATILQSAAKVATAGAMGVRVVLSPTDYVAMMLQKASTSGNWLGLPPGIAMPPIVQSSGVPAGKVLVTAVEDGAFTAVRSLVSASIGLDGDDFSKNLRTILVEGRMVSGVRNPEFSIAGDLKSA